MLRSYRSFAVLVIAALAVATCSPAEERPADLMAPQDPLVWPTPPLQARIKYLHGFREPSHLGIRAGFLERVWEVVAGAENREMVRPYAIAVEGSTIAVADPGLGAVHIYDPEEGVYERIVQAGDVALRSPVGVALGDGLIFVADSALAKVFSFDRGGQLVRTIEGIERPTGLAFDADGGRLFVADTLAHRILAFDTAGRRLAAFGGRGTEPGQFNYPSHLALSGGRLYVNDTMNFRVQILGLDGQPLGQFGDHGDGSGSLAQPKGIGVDPEGHIYVADSLFDRVQIFNDEGGYLLDFGGTGHKPGAFWLPSGLFLAEDRIYVADSYNRRVQVFQFLGGG